MEESDAITCFAALAHPTRLALFRALIAQAPEGLAAGMLARSLAIPPNTLSTHLAVLSRAGLIRGARRGRSILYRAELARLRDLNLYLIRDCCNGRAEICAPLLAALAPACPATESRHV